MSSIFSLPSTLGPGTQSILFIFLGGVLLISTRQLMLAIAIILVLKPPLESDFTWLTELP